MNYVVSACRVVFVWLRGFAWLFAFEVCDRSLCLPCVCHAVCVSFCVCLIVCCCLVFCLCLRFVVEICVCR